MSMRAEQTPLHFCWNYISSAQSHVSQFVLSELTVIHQNSMCLLKLVSHLWHEKPQTVRSLPLGLRIDRYTGQLFHGLLSWRWAAKSPWNWREVLLRSRGKDGWMNDKMAAVQGWMEPLKYNREETANESKQKLFQTGVNEGSGTPILFHSLLISAVLLIIPHFFVSVST